MTKGGINVDNKNKSGNRTDFADEMNDANTNNNNNNSKNTKNK